MWHVCGDFRRKLVLVPGFASVDWVGLWLARAGLRMLCELFGYMHDALHWLLRCCSRLLAVMMLSLRDATPMFVCT
jgi:hypothetical protein